MGRHPVDHVGILQNVVHAVAVFGDGPDGPVYQREVERRMRTPAEPEVEDTLADPGSNIEELAAGVQQAALVRRLVCGVEPEGAAPRPVEGQRGARPQEECENHANGTEHIQRRNLR